MGRRGSGPRLVFVIASFASTAFAAQVEAQPQPQPQPDARASERASEGASSTSTSTSGDPSRALAMARAAFEYRDFGQVVAALDPWVHPPRIRDREDMVAARELLGVSLHVQGDERGAREEFAQLLLLAPSHELDPFVIPPQVIATFEEVRDQLGPRLASKPSVSAPPDSRPDPGLNEALLWAPLGIPQLTSDETAAGLLFGLTQVMGLALNLVAFERARALGRVDPKNDADRADLIAEQDLWLAAQFGGLGLFGLAYGASVVYGHAAAPGEPPAGPSASARAPRALSFSLRF